MDSDGDAEKEGDPDGQVGRECRADVCEIKFTLGDIVFVDLEETGGEVGLFLRREELSLGRVVGQEEIGPYRENEVEESKDQEHAPP